MTVELPKPFMVSRTIFHRRIKEKIDFTLRARPIHIHDTRHTLQCLFRHIRIDGDCTGATKGMKALIKATWPEKEVYIIDEEKSGYLAFLGGDDAPVEDEL